MNPILFNTEMVRSLLSGVKTCTRRVVKGAHFQWDFWCMDDNAVMTGIRADGEEYPLPVEGLWAVFIQDGNPEFLMLKAPYQPGDILWVRETWYQDTERYMYRADYSKTEKFYRNGKEVTVKWRPSIHMPKDAARIFLQVKNVRVERLQDVGYEGCKAEGIWDDYKTHSEKYHENLAERAYPVVFSEFWDCTIKKQLLPRYGWDANPWVWVIEFERISKEAALEAEKEQKNDVARST
ncbi:MAG: hypothetical protein DBY27_03095 [Clostridiaceae bacterium]|nr:MAG: hypothetical protein DBY27_03095 [Clostridiaceae bacterium]